jgi:hypothetical protein
MPVAALLACVAGFWFKDRKISWTVVHLFAPLTNIYSAAVLAEWLGPLEAAISYLPVLLVGGYIHSGMPMYVVGIVILVRAYWPQLRAGLRRQPALP